MFEKVKAWLGAKAWRAHAFTGLASVLTMCSTSLGTISVATGVPPHKVLASFVPNFGPSGPNYNVGGRTQSNAGTFDNLTLGKEGPIHPTGPIDAGACTTVYIDQSQIACGELVMEDFIVAQKALGDLSNAAWFEKLEFLGAGSCTTGNAQTPDGGTWGAVTFAPLTSPSLIDASAGFVEPDAGLLAIQVCAPGSTSTYGVVSPSEVKVLPTFQGTSTTQIDAGGHYVLAPYPNTLPPIVDSGAGGLAFLIPGAYGDMSPGVATAGAFTNGTATWPCTPFVPFNEHLAYCTMPNGIYDAGGGDAALTVTVASSMNPAPCPGCVTIGAGIPAPTITSIVPNLGTAAGGWNVTVTGTNFIVGATTLSLNGNPLSSVSCSTTVCTGLTPAYSPTTGSGATGYGIVATTAGGTATGSTIPSKYWYLSSTNTFVGMWQADTIATANAASWVDQNGAQNWSQVTGANQPAVSTGFNGGSLKYITCSGSPVNMTNTFATPVANGQLTSAIVANYTAVSSTTNALFQLTGTGFNFSTYASTTTLFGSDTVSGSATYATGLTTAAHVLTATLGAANAGNVWFDSTNTSGTIHNGTNVGGAVNTLCNSAAVGGYGTANIPFVAFWSGVLPGTDLTNLRASLKAVYGTP